MPPNPKHKRTMLVSPTPTSESSSSMVSPSPKHKNIMPPNLKRKKAMSIPSTPTSESSSSMILTEIEINDVDVQSSSPKELPMAHNPPSPQEQEDIKNSGI